MLLLASMQSVYELMLVFRPDFGLEENPIRELVTKLIADRTIKTLTIIGKKRLAYPIKKHTEGVYAVVEVIGSQMNVGSFEKQLKLTNDIIRFLLIKKE